MSILCSLCLVYSVGCATKRYYYHPHKTPAEMQADYAQCLRQAESRFVWGGPSGGSQAATWGADNLSDITKLMEKCMKSRGYRLVSEKEANRLGIQVIPPQM